MLDRLKHLLVDVRSGGQLHNLEVDAALLQRRPQLDRLRQGLAVGEAHRGKDGVDGGALRRGGADSGADGGDQRLLPQDEQCAA